jgi:hypothetical protein
VTGDSYFLEMKLFCSGFAQTCLILSSKGRDGTIQIFTTPRQ